MKWPITIQYRYASAGNVTNAVYDDGRDLALTWDGAYRLTSVANTRTVVETYGYDALDRRVWISDGAETNHLIHAGPHVVAETDSAGTLTRSYAYGPGIDNILAMTVYAGGTTTTYWYVTDHLNTVWALVDETGTVVESYDYDAWGNVHAFDESGTPISESAVGNRYLFQGREYSWVTGLYYFRARWYDPITGRWLSNDPIGISGGLNQYVVFNNNPVNNRDPDGLFVISGALLLRSGLGAVAGIAEGYIISKISGEDYSWKKAGVDATFGAAGGAVSAIGKAYKAAKLAKTTRTATRVTDIALDIARKSSRVDDLSSAAILVSDARKLKYAADIRHADALIGVGAGLLSEGAARIGSNIYDKLTEDDNPHADGSCN